MFRALVLRGGSDAFDARLDRLDHAELPDAEVQVAVDFSTINYKDALAICNRAPIVRKWPMVPGIDGTGTVTASRDARFAVGDQVLLNGWGVGESHWGCLAQAACLRSDWLIHRPSGLSGAQVMAIGTAGYTAMLCALAIEDHGVEPSHGPVLITGATGGVGSIAIAVLSAWGYEVVASTGKMDEAPYLKQMGAVQVIDREALASPGKPLGRETWAAVVDSVGSHTLVNACAATRYRGIVAACGLAQGMEFQGSVAPFILRGVTLAGIDSVKAPLAVRGRAWGRLAQDLDRSKLDLATQTIPLDGVVDAAHRLMRGEVRGRIVVDVNG